MYVRKHYNEDAGTFWYTVNGDNHEVMTTSETYPDEGVLDGAVSDFADNMAKHAGDGIFRYPVKQFDGGIKMFETQQLVTGAKPGKPVT